MQTSAAPTNLSRSDDRLVMTEEHPGHPEFDFSGGALCLDFCNTASTHVPLVNERLVDYAALLEWGAQAGVLDERTRGGLEAAAIREPSAAAEALAGAREFRLALYELFSAAAAGRHGPPIALETLDRTLHRALGHLHLVPSAPGYAWQWDLVRGGLDRFLAPVAASAALVLTSPERLARVRVCDAETCQWTFLDRSRNGRRRWCDMSSCGNRAKAKRHYERTRAASGADRPSPG